MVSKASKVQVSVGGFAACKIGPTIGVVNCVFAPDLGGRGSTLRGPCIVKVARSLDVAAASPSQFGPAAMKLAES